MRYAWRHTVDRIAAALSSRPAVAFSVLIAFMAMGLALYVEVRQINLTDCQAAYSEASAKRSAIVTEIATQDRALDRSDAEADAVVAVARRADDQASRATLLAVAARDRTQMQTAFARWLATSGALEQAQDSAQKVKDANAKQRMRNEQERKRNPLPAPPSQRCG